MQHVFISYVKENKEEVDRLCKDLTAHGIRVWRDKMEDSWKNWIYRCGTWLRNVYGFGSYREIYHTHFFESF